MKKKDRELLNNIKTSLENVSDSEKLPEVISKENIVSVVEHQEQAEKARMSSKQKRATAFASIAAVFVLCVCVFFAHRAAKNPSAVVPTPTTTKTEESIYGDAPLYQAANYEAIEQRFIKVAKKLATEATLAYNTDGLLTGADGVKEFEKTAEASVAPATDNASPAPEGGASVADGKGGAGEDDFSKTNIQVEGVDEADIVKTDGKFLYIVSDDFDLIKNSKGEKTTSSNTGKIKIVDIKNNEEMKLVSEFLPKVKNKEIRVREMYVNGNNLIVICNEWDYVENENGFKDYFTYDTYFKENTLVVVFDITDRGEPKEKGRYEQNGSYLSSRLIGNRVYVFSNFNVNVYQSEDLVKESCVPQCGENGSLSRIAAEDISVMRSTDRTGYLVIGSINFYGEELSSTSKAILGGGDESYCTKDTLYISNSVYDYELYTNQQLTDEEITVDMGRTEIFAFLLNEGRIEYKNYGTVSGIVDDQFSMDEYNGYFRIATTVGWNGYSIVTVLDKNLKRVGELTKIAEGESIYSVRFIGDTAYVVTYENHDPLHVIDLSDPKKPKILGQLEVPGFSSYLHPISEKYILGIGQNRDEEGNLEEDRMNTKVSVFDISDPTNPTEVYSLILDGYSEAQDNHKALTVLPDGSFVIPIEIDSLDSYSGEYIIKSVRFSVDENGYISFKNNYYSEHAVEVYEDPRQQEEPEATEETGEIVDEGFVEETDYDIFEYYNFIGRTVYSNSVIYNIGSFYVEAYDLESGEKIGEVKTVDSHKFLERDLMYYDDYPVVTNSGVAADGVSEAGVPAETTEAVTN